MGLLNRCGVIKQVWSCITNINCNSMVNSNLKRNILNQLLNQIPIMGEDRLIESITTVRYRHSNSSQGFIPWGGIGYTSQMLTDYFSCSLSITVKQLKKPLFENIFMFEP